jgi:Starch binding domain
MVVRAARAVAIVAAIALIDAASPATISGTLLSIGAEQRGIVITLARTDGSPTAVTVGSDAVVRDRASGGSWRTASIEDLKAGEPISLRIDSHGIAREIDAQFDVVDTRVVALSNGYLVGSDGIARKLVGAAAGLSTIPFGAYVELKTDGATGDAFDTAVSMHPFASAANRVVAVTFEALVPLNTPAGSTIYLATNAQSWTPNSIRMNPEPGNKWTTVLQLPAGTTLQYKYTRGSWSSEERDAAGSQIPNRTLNVLAAGSSQAVNDTILRWADLPS